MRSTHGSILHPPRALLLPVLMAAVVVGGCGASQARSTAPAAPGSAVAVDVAPVELDIDQVGGALRELRDARTQAEIQERYPQLRMAADALAASLSAVAAQYEATVAAGQQALSSSRDQGTGRPPARQGERPPAVADLAMALDSLLMCRTAYDQVSSAYRSQLQQLTRALERDRTVDGMQAVAPAITGLLEDQGELRSVLTDVSAKSKAVRAEMAMVPRPP